MRESFAFKLPQVCQPPCKDCSERYVGCHSKCDGYAKYKEQVEKFRVESRSEVRPDRIKYIKVTMAKRDKNKNKWRLQ